MAGKKGSQNKPGTKNPDVAPKWARALELRASGKTFQEIADELGYSDPSGAYKAVQEALDATVREPADQARALEVDRLDRLTGAVWERAMRGDDFAVDRVLKIMDRRSKLLGLDAPIKTEVAGPDGGAVLMTFAQSLTKAYGNGGDPAPA